MLSLLLIHIFIYISERDDGRDVNGSSDGGGYGPEPQSDLTAVSNIEE